MLRWVLQDFRVGCYDFFAGDSPLSGSPLPLRLRLLREARIDAPVSENIRGCQPLPAPARRRSRSRALMFIINTDPSRAANAAPTPHVGRGRLTLGRRTLVIPLNLSMFRQAYFVL